MLDMEKLGYLTNRTNVAQQAPQKKAILGIFEWKTIY